MSFMSFVFIDINKDKDISEMRGTKMKRVLLSLLGAVMFMFVTILNVQAEQITQYFYGEVNYFRGDFGGIVALGNSVEVDITFDNDASCSTDEDGYYPGAISNITATFIANDGSTYVVGADTGNISTGSSYINYYQYNDNLFGQLPGMSSLTGIDIQMSKISGEYFEDVCLPSAPITDMTTFSEYGQISLDVPEGSMHFRIKNTTRGNSIPSVPLVNHTTIFQGNGVLDAGDVQDVDGTIVSYKWTLSRVGMFIVSDTYREYNGKTIEINNLKPSYWDATLVVRDNLGALNYVDFIIHSVMHLPGDFNADGVVDGQDLAAFGIMFGH